MRENTDGIGPMPGDVVKNPDFASVLRDMSEKGVIDGFYRGNNYYLII